MTTNVEETIPEPENSNILITENTKDIDPRILANPIAVLVDCLKKDDIENRVKTIANLRSFCIALGPIRSRDELIPFIKGKISSLKNVLSSQSNIFLPQKLKILHPWPEMSIPNP